MRLNYYRFPEGIDARTRFLSGADFARIMFLAIKAEDARTVIIFAF